MNSISVVCASLILEYQIMNVKDSMIYGVLMGLAGTWWSFTITQKKTYQKKLNEKYDSIRIEFTERNILLQIILIKNFGKLIQNLQT